MDPSGTLPACPRAWSRAGEALDASRRRVVRRVPPGRASVRRAEWGSLSLASCSHETPAHVPIWLAVLGARVVALEAVLSFLKMSNLALAFGGACGSTPKLTPERLTSAVRSLSPSNVSKITSIFGSNFDGLWTDFGSEALSKICHFGFQNRSKICPNAQGT